MFDDQLDLIKSGNTARISWLIAVALRRDAIGFAGHPCEDARVPIVTAAQTSDSIRLSSASRPVKETLKESKRLVYVRSTSRATTMQLAFG